MTTINSPLPLLALALLAGLAAASSARGSDDASTAEAREAATQATETVDDEPVRLTASQRSAEKAAMRKLNSARTYLRAGHLIKARDIYISAIKSIEMNFGANDLRLIDPLRDLSTLYALGNYKPKEAVKTRQRIVQIYDSYEGEVSDAERLEALVQLGDHAVMAKRTNVAADAYVDAWQLLARTQSPDQANEYFASPESIHLVPPAFNPTREIDKNVIVVVNLVIDTQGRARQVELDTVPDPAVKMSRDIRRAVSKGRFRPLVADGALKDTETLRMRLAYPRTGGYPIVAF